MFVFNVAVVCAVVAVLCAVAAVVIAVIGLCPVTVVIVLEICDLAEIV